jgi:hypothetical protein
MIATDLLVPGMKAKHCQSPRKNFLQMVAENDIRLNLPNFPGPFQREICISALSGNI